VTEEWTDSEKGIFNAVTTGDLDAVKQMLESGLDPSLKDSEGMTPLHFATDRGHLEIVKILLQNGASIDGVNSDGQTPLMIALTCEHAVCQISPLLWNVTSLPSVGNNKGTSQRWCEFRY
jgi:ankyrin repeat protein